MTNRIIMMLIGLLCAFLTTLLGVFLYTQFLLKPTEMRFFELLTGGLGGKIIAIGSLLNIPIVYLFLQKEKWEIVRGIIAGLIILVVISQFV